jgi:uncharacterized membrane protein
MESMTLEEVFKNFAGYVALILEAISVVLIAIGAVEAIRYLIRPKHDPLIPFAWMKEVFLRLGSWLLLGLEFALAADIVRTAISPTWAQVGQLASIAAIRTALNYFLEKDIEKFTENATVAEEKQESRREVEAGA